MASVDNFFLYKPGDLIELRGRIRNILDWGAGKRLADIGNALDALLEEVPQQTTGKGKRRVVLTAPG